MIYQIYLGESLYLRADTAIPEEGQMSDQLSHDGGPAFPREDYQLEGGPGQRGMSMRDYFAGQVISQCHITVEKHAPEEADPMLVEAYAFRYARTAYAIADAMLVERAKFKAR